MLDEGRRRSMREYQQRRGAARREHGLVTRTAWIRSEDVEAFKSAIAPLVDHARIVEAVIGSVTVDPVEIVAIINKHKFRYDPQDIIFIMRFAETMALKPTEQAETRRRAEAIIQQYGFHLTVDDLI